MNISTHRVFCGLTIAAGYALLLLGSIIVGDIESTTSQLWHGLGLAVIGGVGMVGAVAALAKNQ